MSGREALQKQLRAEPPAGLDLPPEELQQLADLIRSARETQGKELEASLLGALDHIPRPLRGPVRKVFGL
ncbi:hypothetical protein [Nocardioides cavernaquae]|uniref:Uncharacterized protein n=1 Tax=Nocardioides cavernaquae TaxID=2321396 RepID=A0A3A5H5T2_9ACTN|nr:hypothetical protein [Nocardioides cavernaquae]RJS46036.1 hypothetical protein D4739_07250 [Nocardioides cavernaquae]